VQQSLPFVIGFVVAFVLVRALVRVAGWVLGAVVAHPVWTVGLVALLAPWSRLA